MKISSWNRKPYQGSCLKASQPSVALYRNQLLDLLCKSNDCFIYEITSLVWNGLDQCYHHIEIIQGIWAENSFAGFYMMVRSLNR